MIEYVNYLRTNRSEWHNKFMAKSALRLARQEQEVKNATAPVISGSGASSGGVVGKVVGESGSYTPTSIDFKGLKAGRANPAPGARISQGWGKSRIKYAAGRHTGVDYAGKHGSRINAAASGVVVSAGWDGAYGNTIKIRHADGKTSLYGHLSGIGVKKGQKVSVGQSIGKMGSTGRSTGTHLHFEVRGRDKYGTDFNPSKW